MNSPWLTILVHSEIHCKQSSIIIERNAHVILGKLDGNVAVDVYELGVNTGKAIGGVPLGIGVSLIVVFFVGKKMPTKEMEALCSDLYGNMWHNLRNNL